MKKYILRLFVFVIPIILVSALLEYKTRTLESYYKDKRHGLESNIENVEVLIFGNSLSADGIDPNQFSMETYNMAFRAQSLYFDKRIAIKYLDQLTSLKYVFISLSYTSLYATHKAERDVFYHYFHDLDYMDENFFKEDLSYFYFGYTPPVAVQNIFDFKQRVPLSKGWISYDMTNNDMMNKKDAQKRVDYFQSIIEQNSSKKESMIADLNDFIKILQDKGVTPILITPPFHDILYSLLDPDQLVKDSIDFHQIAEKNGIGYWNFVKAPFEDTDFFNPDHLNENGAAKFAGMLNQKILIIEQSKSDEYITLSQPE